MSKPWGGIGIGAWADEAERADEEQAAEAKATAADVQSFPSLKEAASNAKSKKKKKMTLSEFASGAYTAPGGRNSVGLTQQEILQLPTGPRQRSEDEMQPGRLGGGFSSYGGRSGGPPGRMGRDRDDSDGSWGGGGGGRRPYGGGFDDDRRGPSSRVSDFPQTSRADEVDDWGKAKKPLPSFDQGRQSRYGGGLGGGGSFNGGGGGGVAWSVIEYGNQLAANGELGHSIDAIKWGTDYFIKAHPEPNVLYGEVGDGNTDHYCWQRPEEMTTDRKAYRIDPSNPGSDLAGETAAAMAAASIVFRRSNPAYSRLLLTHAYQLFDFADKYRGKYDSSITVARKYYQSVSGYNDELLWAAAWLYQASNNQFYLDYLGRNGDSMGGTGWSMTEFGWDVKYAGVQTLVAKFLMQGKAGRHTPVFQKFQQKADFFMCSLLGKGSRNIQKTPGGLIFRQRWNNMQFVTSASFLTTVYSDYLTSSRSNLRCAAGNVAPSQLLSFAKSQVDYILGDNPRATSYMVGYGNNFPQRVHHRGSSIVSYKVDRTFVTCRGGYATWFSRKGSDPNLLTGAIVGGPDAYDNFADRRDNYEQTEPATYNNAPLLGVLARLSSGHSGYSQLLPVVPAPVVRRPMPIRKPKVTFPVRASGPVAIVQKVTGSWVSKGRTYYRYSTTVINKSPRALKSLNLSIKNLYGPIWGLSRSGNSFGLPSWMHSLQSGKSLEFVYIHSTSPANVAVSSYTLA